MGSARVNAKQRQGRRAKERKGIETQRAKPPTSARAIDPLIGDKEQKERNRVRAPNAATLDTSVPSYDPHGTHGEPILLTIPPAQLGELLLLGEYLAAGSTPDAISLRNTKPR